MKSGRGKWRRKMTNQKCNQYEGEYQRDKKHGVGYFEWESGNSYAGNYSSDERSGYGVMRWTDGSVYMGMWARGIQEGVGVMIFPDKKKRAGYFEKNVFRKPINSISEIRPYKDKLATDCVSLIEEFITRQQRFQPTLNVLPEENESLHNKTIEKEDEDYVTQTVQRVKRQADRAAQLAQQTKQTYPNEPHSRDILKTEKQETYPGLNKDMSFADQLPNRHFTDDRLNQKILMSGPPTLDSDSEFNRHSTIMSHLPKQQNQTTVYSNLHPVEQFRKQQSELQDVLNKSRQAIANSTFVQSKVRPQPIMTQNQFYTPKLNVVQAQTPAKIKIELDQSIISEHDDILGSSQLLYPDFALIGSSSRLRRARQSEPTNHMITQFPQTERGLNQRKSSLPAAKGGKELEEVRIVKRRGKK